MLYSNDLAEYSRKRLEGYLAHKWGGASNLPTGHPFKTTAPDFGGSQSIVTNVHTITGTPPTLSRDIGLFTLEEYNIYATSGLPLSYASDNTSVIAVNNGKLEPKASGTANITLSQAGDTYFTAASNQIFSLKIDGNQSQEITFNTIVDTNTSVSNSILTMLSKFGIRWHSQDNLILESKNNLLPCAQSQQVLELNLRSDYCENWGLPTLFRTFLKLLLSTALSKCYYNPDPQQHFQNVNKPPAANSIPKIICR